MKNINIYIILAALMLGMNTINAQTINWGSLDTTDRHMIHAHAGADYGAVMGAGYGYQIRNKFFPAIATIDYSFPAGEELFDDLKTRIGIQTNWVNFHNVIFSTKIYGVIRRYENDNVRLVNFGSELAGVIGYYRSKWFVAGEIGFDKAIITHFKHTANYHEQFPGVEDGWYGPSTGGNFFYGAQAGVSFGQLDLSVRGGKILTQDFKTTPTFPLYGELGINIRI